MIRKTRLFTPGPTPLLPAAQFAMAAADIHHRTAEFRALYTRVLAQLKQFVGTKNDVIILSSSGTGAMEAAVSNLTSPGDRVLVLTAGKFGERWSALAKAFGCAVDVVEAPYGQTFSIDAVKAALKLETRVVFMQATETSTGVRHCTPAIAKLLKDTQSEALLCVDAITGLGTSHLDMDAWGVDVLIGGSQKGRHDPPGLSYLAVSEAAWDRMEASYNPRYYFRPSQGAQKRPPRRIRLHPRRCPHRRLGAALNYIAGQAATAENPEGDLAQGRRMLVENAETISAMTRAAVTAMGLKLFAPDCPSSAATAVLAPEGVDSGLFVKELKSRFGAIITNGQGEMKGQIFRIAHLGFFDYMDTIALIGALEQVVVKIPPPTQHPVRHRPHRRPKAVRRTQRHRRRRSQMHLRPHRRLLLPPTRRGRCTSPSPPPTEPGAPSLLTDLPSVRVGLCRRLNPAKCTSSSFRTFGRILLITGASCPISQN